MLNPIHLRTLLEVVQQGSFAAAANRLGYTASAVSQQMTALEQTVGVALFERTARSAHPTDAARAMARAAVPVFADLDAILEAARHADEARSGELDVVLYSSLARAILPRVLHDEAFVADGTRLRLSVRNPSSAIRSLSDGGWPDVSFVYRYTSSDLAWPALVTEVGLGSDPYRFVCPASWGLHLGAPPSVEQLSALDWAGLHAGSSDATAIENAFRTGGIHPRYRVRSDEFEVILDLVAAGSAAAFVPGSVARLAPAGVVAIDVPGLSLARTVHALVSPTAPAAATTSLLDAVRRALPDAGILDAGLAAT
ncbi:LysR family transcriptional regulator [Leifsonia kafniensis]|uniref:LysR family transcriptional regulator n=1 Tax=Leifsonia kafniensis TaxID=475957 RepID=A0ABP7KQF7_9MICO